MVKCTLMGDEYENDRSLNQGLAFEIGSPLSLTLLRQTGSASVMKNGKGLVFQWYVF
ncbi:MAG: hypothetical protein FWC41_00985 [Firmicutes bacterium]|nr:hypothetical protein [Bacillota bacterium]